MGALHRELSIYSADGLKLFGQQWSPEGPTQAELLVVHGYFEHGGRYREFAHALAGAGIATTVFDLRGHGRSEGRRGFVSRFEDYGEDVQAALGTLSPGPRFLLGHSLGGLIAIDFAGRSPAAGDLKGLVIASPFLGLTVPVPPLKRWIGELAADVWPKLAVPTGLDPAGVSRDASIVEAYRRDPLVFTRATAGWFRESARAQRGAAELRRLELPLLLAYGDSDPIASPAATRAWIEAVSCPEKTVRLLPGARHEVLNEIGRQELHREIGTWILAHSGTGAETAGRG